MMKKVLVLMFVVLVSLLPLSAQSDVVTAGGKAVGSAGTVEFSIGQIAVQRAEADGAYILEGVQQPYEISVVGTDKYPSITLEAKVYPNPTTDVALLRIDNFEQIGGKLSARLIDGDGRQLRELTLVSPITEIDMVSWSSGTYYLNLFNGKKLLKSFKIVRMKN